jgi:predicted transposase YbfD/YdcC
MKKILFALLFSTVLLAGEGLPTDNVELMNLQLKKTFELPPSFYSLSNFCVLHETDIVFLDGKGCQLGLGEKIKRMKGTGPGELNFPILIDYDSWSKKIAIVDFSRRTVNIYNDKLVFVSSFHIALPPYDMKFKKGKIYLTYNNETRFIEKFNMEGECLASYKTNEKTDINKISDTLPWKVTVDNDENVFIAYQAPFHIIKLNKLLIPVCHYTIGSSKDFEKFDNRDTKMSSPFDKKSLKTIVAKYKKIISIVDICYSDLLNSLLVLFKFDNGCHKVLFFSQQNLQLYKIAKLHPNSQYVIMKTTLQKLYLLTNNAENIDVYGFDGSVTAK